MYKKPLTKNGALSISKVPFIHDRLHVVFIKKIILNKMNKFQVFLNSNSTWSFVVAFLVAGLTAIQPQLSGAFATTAQVILMVLGMYLHTNEVKVAGQTGMLGGKSIR